MIGNANKIYIIVGRDYSNVTQHATILTKHNNNNSEANPFQISK